MLVLGRKVSQRTIITHRSGEKIEILVTRVQADQGGGFKINIGFEEPDGRRNFDVQRPERALRREADKAERDAETYAAFEPFTPEKQREWAKRAEAYDKLQADAIAAANDEVARLEQSIEAKARAAKARREA